ncbi:MAG: hypothetical protein OXD33_09010 [Rhodobacteraceae bacterium]|nr:hypothetical protein [Paracoccaceae bacterium]
MWHVIIPWVGRIAIVPTVAVAINSIIKRTNKEGRKNAKSARKTDKLHAKIVGKLSSEQFERFIIVAAEYRKSYSSISEENRETLREVASICSIPFDALLNYVKGHIITQDRVEKIEDQTP